MKALGPKNSNSTPVLANAPHIRGGPGMAVVVAVVVVADVAVVICLLSLLLAGANVVNAVHSRAN